MEALTASESVLEVAFAAAALVVALWSIQRSLRAAEGRATGDFVWSIVAAAILAVVVAAVRFGVHRGA